MPQTERTQVMPPEGEPIAELLVTALFPEQIKVLEQYRLAVEPVWLQDVLYSNLILPAGSVHRADPSQGADIWIIILPGGMQVPYHRLEEPYAILRGNE